MPYPNEYACRLMPKKNIITCRSMDRQSATYGKKYRAIICQFRDVKLGTSKWYIQSLRFDKENWTEAQARTLCSRYEGDFEGLKEPEEETRKMELPPGKFVRKRDVIRLEDGSGILVREYPLIKAVGEGSQYRKVFIPGHCVERTEAQIARIICSDRPWDGMKERALYPIDSISQRKALERTCLYVFHVRSEDLPEDEPEGSTRLPPSHFAYIPPLCFHSDGALSSKALAHSFGVLAGARRRDGPTGWSGINKLETEDRRKAGRCIFLGLASLSEKCEVKFSDPPDWLELAESSYRKYKWWEEE